MLQWYNVYNPHNLAKWQAKKDDKERVIFLQVQDIIGKYKSLLGVSLLLQDNQKEKTSLRVPVASRHVL